MQNSFPGVTHSGHRLALMGILLAGLAACGGGSDVLGGIESLGAVFQQAFAQGPNTAPVDVTNAGLTLDVTAEPFAL